MVKDELVETIRKHLADHGRVFVQTDVDFLSDEVFDLFEGSGFEGEAIDSNPLPVKSERQNRLKIATFQSIARSSAKHKSRSRRIDQIEEVYGKPARFESV